MIRLGWSPCARLPPVRGGFSLASPGFPSRFSSTWAAARWVAAPKLDKDASTHGYLSSTHELGARCKLGIAESRKEEENHDSENPKIKRKRYPYILYLHKSNKAHVRSI